MGNRLLKILNTFHSFFKFQLVFVFFKLSGVQLFDLQVTRCNYISLSGALYLEPTKWSFFFIFFNKKAMRQLHGHLCIIRYMSKLQFLIFFIQFFQNSDCSSHLLKVLRKIDFYGNRPTAQTNDLKDIKFFLFHALVKTIIYKMSGH